MKITYVILLLVAILMILLILLKRSKLNSKNLVKELKYLRMKNTENLRDVLIECRPDYLPYWDYIREQNLDDECKKTEKEIEQLHISLTEKEDIDVRIKMEKLMANTLYKIVKSQNNH